MMNTVTFFVLGVAAQAWVIWLAYTMGFNNGWLDQMEERNRCKTRNL